MSGDFFQEFFDQLAKDEAEANKNLTEDQKDIGYGDYFLRIWNPPMDEPLLIFGHVMPREEYASEETRLGASKAELSWTMRAADDAYERGYRFGRCFSEVVPDGELGSTHVSTMLRKITRDEFEAAKKRGWK